MDLWTFTLPTLYTFSIMMLAIHAIILIGGYSQRMGYDKAQLRWQGQTMLQKTINVAKQAGCTATYIGTRSSQSHEPTDLRYQKIVDIWQNAGPVSSIISAIIHLNTISSSSQSHYDDDVALFIPVDLPNLTAATLRALIEKFSQSPADALHVAGHPLPLLLRQNSRVLRYCENCVKNLRPTTPRALSVRQFLAHFNVEEYHPPQVFEKELFNSNTPEEWKAAKNQSAKSL